MAKTNGKGPSLLDQYLAADWPRQREKGRSNFIWKRIVFPIGVPTAVLATLWVFYELKLGPADVITARGVGWIYVVFVFMIAGVYRYASGEWSRREDEYLRTNSPNSHDPVDRGE